MAVDARLKAALVKKTGFSERHLDRLISERAASLVLTREQAAIALATELGVSVTRFASDTDLAVIRQAKAGVPGPNIAATPSAPPASSRQGTNSTGRSVSKKSAARAAARRPRSGPKRKVFVVHGRDVDRKKAMFSFLRSINLHPVEWSSAVKATGDASPYIGQILDAGLKDAAAVVVLLTPDDEAHLKREFRKRTDPPYESVLTGQPRPNVLFEAGLAFGRLDKRTVLVQIGDIRPFSDVGGRHVIHLDNSPEQRSELANRLSAAGCDVDLSGTDWYSEGDFSA